jgi:NTP pyrophosphatase (non-canonical NTP hydrolase)
VNIQEFQTIVHQLAIKKGWYDTERSALESHMLVVSEVAEATEEVRKGAPPIYQTVTAVYAPITIVTPDMKGVQGQISWDDTRKPEGELIELADAVIRIMDYCESRGFNLQDAIRIKHEYNKTRPYRHGGKVV